MKFVVAFLIVVVWPGATAWALSVTPPRGGDAGVDLAYDPHWWNRTPPAPTVGEKAARRVTATSTTTRVVPRRTVVPRAPVPRSTAGVEQWRDEVAVYGDWDVDLMLAIMRCESGGRADAKNRYSTATGLFQILGGPYDPVANISLAHSMWSTRGTQPWNASRGCWG